MLVYDNTLIDEGMINHQYSGKDKNFYMSVEPMLLKANKEQTVTIKSKYNYMRLEGKFDILIAPCDNYNYIPFEGYINKVITTEAINGEISFKYFFENEQEYRIIVGEHTSDGVKLFLKSSVYALNEDLYSLSSMIGDLHCHTIYSDGFESPEKVVESAISKGMEFIAITDHNSYIGSVKAWEYAKEKKLPITVVHGEEYSSSFTNMHIISLGAKAAMPADNYSFTPAAGITFSVCEYIEKFVSQIRENGGIAVMCHPLWKPLIKNKPRYDVPDNVVRGILEKNIFNAVEIVSGSPDTDYYTGTMQLQLAYECGATPLNIAYIGVTDSHHYSFDDIAGRHFTMIWSNGNSESDIIDSIISKRTVAIQIIDKQNALCFGQIRYARYARFLLKRKYGLIM